ncbi:MAG: sensor histidine kinase [Candidatus Dormibacteria bacterium]
MAGGSDRPWEIAALHGMDALWLRLDGNLKVLEASTGAIEFFSAPAPPQPLINFTRSSTMEDCARAIAGGATGPWEVDLAHFDRKVLLRGQRLSDNDLFLHLDDRTGIRHLEGVRTDFVANLAHELRTPVASLSLAVETLASDLSADDQQLFIRRVAEETAHIEGLLRAITDLALLEGEVHLAISDVLLRDLVEETWRRVNDRLGAGALENLVAPTMVVRADRVRLAEVLQNLLENAHRYSPGGIPVTVRAQSDATAVKVSVEDQGPGIPPSELTRIFERFYKVDRARTRLGDGSGLGLAIARHLVSAHGGRIWAEARPERGTRVSFTLGQFATI